MTRQVLIAAWEMVLLAFVAGLFLLFLSIDGVA